MLQRCNTNSGDQESEKTAQNSQRSKASNAVLATWSRAVKGVKSFHGLEVCNLVTDSVVIV
jgi:hypothetical protein